jgi:uncharacterized protein (TIGR02646 family)
MRYFKRQELNTNIQSQLKLKTSTVFELSKAQRKEVRLKLYISQQSLCAYCERRIKNIQIDKIKTKDNQTERNEDVLMASHIEHFKEQHDDNSKIFEYENMLLSCEGDRFPIDKNTETPSATQYRRTNISCGFGKEKSRHGEIEIDYALLLNPTDDVSALFSYEDGVVEAHKKCSVEQIKQVDYTIKRLNLGAIRLENERILKISVIRTQLKGLSVEEQKAFVQDLLDETKSDLEPFFSTVKDNFGFMI